MYTFFTINEIMPKTEMDLELLFENTEHILALSQDNRWSLRALNSEFCDDKLHDFAPKANVLTDMQSVLVGSAFGYPPALAIAKEAMRQREFESAATFLEAYLQILETALREQKKQAYFLAKVIQQSDDLELLKGAYVWIKESSSDIVTWISWDFWHYQAPANLFELN